MSTYGELQDRITLDYLNRSDLAAETRRAITAAVRKYERIRWWFNETATSVATSAGQAFVDFPANFLRLDLLQITVNSNDFKLTERSFDWIKDANASRAQGQPTDFAIYQNRIQLFPIPNAIYALPINYMHKLPLLSGTADTSEWTSAIEDLVVYHATKLVWANVLRNKGEAATYQALESEALAAANLEREQRALSKITPTEF